MSDQMQVLAYLGFLVWGIILGIFIGFFGRKP